MDTNQMIIIVSLAVAAMLFSAVLYLRQRARRGRPEEYDLMEGHEFEHYCGELLKKCGFQEVQVTRGSGDYGVDILAEKDGVTYAVQCKCYNAPVGVKAVQEAYAGRDYYDRMVGAVLTNQTPVRIGDRENSVWDGLPGDGILFRDDEGMLRGVLEFDNAVFGFLERKLVNGIICQIAG